MKSVTANPAFAPHACCLYLVLILLGGLTAVSYQPTIVEPLLLKIHPKISAIAT